MPPINASHTFGHPSAIANGWNVGKPFTPAPAVKPAPTPQQLAEHNRLKAAADRKATVAANAAILQTVTANGKADASSDGKTTAIKDEATNEAAAIALQKKQALTGVGIIGAIGTILLFLL